MESSKVRRCVQVSFKQKKKLLEYITKHPELISCKVTEDFTYQDSRRIWQTIAEECNRLPGAVKTWKQWRKTWQDLRSKTKKRDVTGGCLPPSLSLLSAAEKEALGLKNSAETSDYQETTEFVPLESENTEDYQYMMDANQSLSEPESPPETKVFVKHRTKIKNSSKNNSHSSNACTFNCDLLAEQEQRKLQLKEDYINFKKDYLRQKLNLIKEQTEALKAIAKEISDKRSE